MRDVPTPDQLVLPRPTTPLDSLIAGLMAKEFPVETTSGTLYNFYTRYHPDKIVNAGEGFRHSMEIEVTAYSKRTGMIEWKAL